MPTIVLVHGAFHGGWCFDLLIPELAARGIDAVTVDLPLTSLLEDAAAVTEVLDRLEGPVTLLGHSYGGAVVTVAGTHPAVERLVYLTAMAPDDGEPASSGPVEIGEEFMSAFRATPEGLPEVDPARAPAIFFPDAEPAAAAAFAARLRPGQVGGVRPRRAGRLARPAQRLRGVRCRPDPAARRTTGDRGAHRRDRPRDPGRPFPVPGPPGGAGGDPRPDHRLNDRLGHRPDPRSRGLGGCVPVSPATARPRCGCARRRRRRSRRCRPCRPGWPRTARGGRSRRRRRGGRHRAPTVAGRRGGRGRSGR